MSQRDSLPICQTKQDVWVPVAGLCHLRSVWGLFALRPQSLLMLLQDKKMFWQLPSLSTSFLFDERGLVGRPPKSYDGRSLPFVFALLHLSEWYQSYKHRLSSPTGRLMRVVIRECKRKMRSHKLRGNSKLCAIFKSFIHLMLTHSKADTQ